MMRSRTHAGEQMSKVNVRYIVNDVDAAIGFYKGLRGFGLDASCPRLCAAFEGRPCAFAQPAWDGVGRTGNERWQSSAPGGWNRIIQLEARDLDAIVTQLRQAGCRFRSDIIIG